MAHFGNSVEYGLHCLLWLVEPLTEPASSRDLAELQGVSASFVAKIFPRLERAGIVSASDGIGGGYRLARVPGKINILEIVDAIEGEKPLFDCQEIRGWCVLYKDKPRPRAPGSVCAIHAIMLRAEKTMRDELARTTLADLAATVAGKFPPSFSADVQAWLSERAQARRRPRAAPSKARKPGRGGSRPAIKGKGT
jgi:Rrf2 family protein